VRKGSRGRIRCDLVEQRPARYPRGSKDQGVRHGFVGKADKMSMMCKLAATISRICMLLVLRAAMAR
jgi:hypothetical protein